MQTIPNVLANKGIEVGYRKKLKLLIDEMSNSCEYWLSSTYKGRNPLMALDGTPVGNIRKTLKLLRDRWLKKFDKLAPKIAELYTKEILKTGDYALKKALSDIGLSVKFKLTPNMKDNLKAIIIENISLIKSIPEQYLLQVEGVVMRTYSTGRDLHNMVEGIKEIHAVTNRRAELIARDQSNKANAIVIRTRQTELGITEGIWNHSHAGKEPRLSHVAANGKTFKLSEGMLIDGKYILPGEEINCRCTWRGVLPKWTEN